MPDNNPAAYLKKTPTKKMRKSKKKKPGKATFASQMAKANKILSKRK